MIPYETFAHSGLGLPQSAQCVLPGSDSRSERQAGGKCSPSWDGYNRNASNSDATADNDDDVDNEVEEELEVLSSLQLLRQVMLIALLLLC